MPHPPQPPVCKAGEAAQNPGENVEEDQRQEEDKGSEEEEEEEYETEGHPAAGDGEMTVDAGVTTPRKTQA